MSIAGGLDRAPGRGKALGADVIQLFTGQPQRWAERPLPEEEAARFRARRRENGIRFAAAHDSYLINLGSPDPTLFGRSLEAFRAELERCARLGLDALVTHPGSATDGDRRAALRRNVEAIAGLLELVPGPTRVLLETTAGGGTVLGHRFEELADMLEAFPAAVRERIGVCLDTCHVFSAGYDLRDDPAGVVDELDRVVGLGRLGLLHLNDSLGARGSRVDRHAHIGEGRLGEGPFRALLRDPRLRRVPCVIETPKDGDREASDRRNLTTLRRLAAADRGRGPADEGTPRETL